jgi:hypothetical protein
MFMLVLLDPSGWVLPEDGDRIQSPKRCVLRHKQDDNLDKDETMDNVQEHNNCTNLPSSQTFDHTHMGALFQDRLTDWTSVVT